ncbi:MAG: Fic family protein [Gemmataceae bacterium]
MDPLTEPFLTFDPSPAGPTGRVDALVARYRENWAAGRILPNSVEAVRVELTYHSNAIEGSTLTLRDTQLVIEGFEPNTGKSLREIYEARNHDRALRTVEGWAAARPADAPLVEADLLAVHAHVMADIDPAGAGRLRADRVLITGTRFVPPGSHKLPVLIPALLERANRAGVHPVVQAAELHYNLVAVHPFADGNGRTARLLMNYHLLRHGFPHAVIQVERRAEYLAALEEANAGRAEPFAAFVLGCVEQSVLKLIGDEP